MTAWTDADVPGKMRALAAAMRTRTSLSRDEIINVVEALEAVAGALRKERLAGMKAAMNICENVALKHDNPGEPLQYNVEMVNGADECAFSIEAAMAALEKEPTT